MLRPTSAVCGLMVLSTSLAAQNYSGVYSATNDAGGQTVVTLAQNGEKITGNIAGKDVTFQIEGVLEEDYVVGVVTGPQGGLWFEAELDDQQLYLTLIEPDASGEPNYDASTTLVFTRQGVTAQGEVGGNPLAAGNPVAGNPLAGGSRFAGVFSDGNIVLQLSPLNGGDYQGSLTFQGQTFPLAVQPSGSGLQGTFSSGNGEFPLAIEPTAEGVSLSTGGTTYRLVRSQTAGAAPANPLAGGGNNSGGVARGQMGGAAAGGLGDDTPLGREWVNFLKGKKITYMDSYSSGSAGGYSSRIDVFLCGNGEFLYRDQSSVTVDVGGASGFSGGNESNSGRWRVITQGNLAGIELRYGDGRVEQYRLDYQDQKTYANGERVYVTPAEICY